MTSSGLRRRSETDAGGVPDMAVRERREEMPTGFRYRVPTATAKRCGSCSAPATNSAWSPPPRTNRLRALLLGGEDTERDLARATLTDPMLSALARRREPQGASPEQAVRHGEIRRLAHAVRAGRHALAANRAQLQAIVDVMAPGLTERRGIGAVTASQAIVSFSHPGRCRSDAAFAALSGTSPLQASSGKTVRHRLNRGGDRALNCAIHTIDAHRPDTGSSSGRLTNIEASDGRRSGFGSPTARTTL
jgi:Transposase IS116/IS110/IS902 family